MSNLTPSPSGPATTDIPILQGERLTLRAHQLNDFEPLCAMWNSPNVVQYIGGKPRSRAEVWTTTQRSFGCWQLLGFGFWVISHSTSGEFIGEIGFLEGLREIDPAHAGTPEAGWCLCEAGWGKGYANEALALVVAWADTHLECPETCCIIDFDNGASANVATKNGYRFSGNATLGGDSIATYRRKRGS